MLSYSGDARCGKASVSLAQGDPIIVQAAIYRSENEVTDTQSCKR
jgi:hypothetical protein